MSVLDIDCLDPKIQIIKQHIVDWISEFGPCGVGMPRFVSGIKFSNTVERWNEEDWEDVISNCKEYYIYFDISYNESYQYTYILDILKGANRQDRWRDDCIYKNQKLNIWMVLYYKTIIHKEY
jgi:hypothetical protein